MYKKDEIPDDIPDAWEDYYREWKRKWHGKRFKIRSYGLCAWKKVVFLWPNGREFYRLEKDMETFWNKGDRKALRKEYFRGHLKREYFGRQNCFIEFCFFCRDRRSVPKRLTLVAKKLNLKTEILYTYVKFYQQCFLK